MSMPFCEVYIRMLLPALRAIIARELISSYGYTQWSAAKALGITQPLINYYLSGKRGSKLLNSLAKHEDVVKYVKEIAATIAISGAHGEVYCRICSYLRNNQELLKELGINYLMYSKCG